MKDELLALQDLFKETIEKYGIEYASACLTNGSVWIAIRTRNGALIDIESLGEE